MYKRIEEIGAKLLGMLVPSLDAGACGAPYTAHYSGCWQCEGPCGYYAKCDAVCRSGCGCQVTTCYC